MSFGRTIPVGKRKGRGLVALLSALALAFQGFISLAHVHTDGTASHFAVQIAAPSADEGVSATDRGAPKTPGHRGVGDCLLCQSLIAGIGVLPSTPSFSLLEVSVSNAALVYATATFGARSSHIWRSRAPPLFSA